MEQIPEFWRTEVFHPLSVHFPIALLLFACLFKLMALRFDRELWQLGGSFLLITGVIGVWIAVYTGNLADGIVSRKICDPTVLKQHQNLAYVCGWLFTAAAFLDAFLFLKKSFFKFKKQWIRWLVLLLLLVGAGYLMYVGHLGAQLVYQQGAGVYHPSADCAEFE